ncbi:MAG: hypothetical protein L0Y71_09850 [Gemmataceae bacterium]|nr:hypothetical protein [Gemmataceae bacterium]
MYEIIPCPGCRRQLRLPDDVVGCDVVCPTCQTRFIAERPAPGALREPPAQEAPPDLDAGAFSTDPMSVPPANQGVQDQGVQDQGVQAETPPVRLHTSEETDRPIALPRADAGKSRGRKIRGVVVAVAVLGGIVAWILSTLGPPWRPRVVRVAEDDRERRQEVIEAFRGQKPLDADAMAAELKPVFVSLGQAYTAKDVRRIVGHFDLERMFDELAAIEMVPANIRGNRRSSLKGMEIGMDRAAGQQAVFLNWTETEIRSVKKLQGNEAVVIARHRGADGTTFKLRWWFSKRTGAWRVFDYEDLDAGMRVTTVMASMTAQMTPGKVAGITAAVQHLQQAMVAAIQRNPEAAERHLRQTDGFQLPRELDALRSMTRGLVHIQRNQPKEALASFDKAQGFNPDMPILQLLKAMACNDLGEHAAALGHLEAYQALLGDDANTCVELGQALLGLQRIPEAQAAYRKALDHDAKNADAFMGLMHALGPDDPHEELAMRFAKLDRPHENFDICAQDCRQAQDGASLEQIALAMRKIDPTYEPVVYHLGLSKLWLGKSEAAAELFQGVFAKEKNAVKRREYLDGYVQAMVDLGKAMEAYRSLPDAGEALERLGAELRRRFPRDELRQLLAEHRKKHPDDVRLLLYQGELHVDDGRYALADKAFAAAVAAKPPADVLQPFEYSRIVARYHTGNALAAWREIGSRRQTFSQLAHLCLNDDNDKLLQTLLDAHAKADPQDESVVMFRVRLAARRGKVQEAVRLFRAALAKTTEKEARDRLMSDFAFAMVEAGKPVEAYHALPDATRAFEMLANDMREFGDSTDLSKLIDAHRRRQPDDVAIQRETAELLIDERKWDEAVAALAEAMKKAPNRRDEFRWSYRYAMHKAGRGLEAYRAEPDAASFQQLANLMAMDKQGKELAALIEAHRPQGAGDALLIFYEIRAKARTGQAAAALALLQRAQKQGGAQVRLELSNLLHDLDDAGLGIEAYRVVADKAAAFTILARRWTDLKKDKALAPLLDEHAKIKPADPWLEHYRGELQLLRGAAEPAAAHFAAAHRQLPARNRFATRQALFRARVKSEQTVATYREFGQGTGTFDDLARQCQQDKNAAELTALLAAHRQVDPEDGALPMWDVELARLNNDDAAALKLLAAHHELFRQPRFRSQAHGHRVRCLIRTKQLPEALREALAFAQKQRGLSVTLILAHAAQGDVKQTLAVMESHRVWDFFLGDCYRDPDLGPILRGDRFAAFRERYPEPKEP